MVEENGGRWVAKVTLVFGIIAPRAGDIYIDDTCWDHLDQTRAGNEFVGFQRLVHRPCRTRSRGPRGGNGSARLLFAPCMKC